MKDMNLKIRRLQFVLYSVVLVNIVLVITAFRDRTNHEKFEEIDVARINVVDKNGVVKMVIASNNKIRQDSRDAGVDKEAFKASGILFRNEEGEECGGLIFSGKKTAAGQEAGTSLTFDQYNQDQNVVLTHQERIDSTESAIDDGLIIIQRPNYTKVEEEYHTYDLLDKLTVSPEKRDSIRNEYAKKDIISRRRLFIGTRRGNKDQKPYNETGLFIKTQGGNNKIGIYVDNQNVPHFEVYGEDGKKVIKDYILSKTK